MKLLSEFVIQTSLCHTCVLVTISPYHHQATHIPSSAALPLAQGNQSHVLPLYLPPPLSLYLNSLLGHHQIHLLGAMTFLVGGAIVPGIAQIAFQLGGQPKVALQNCRVPEHVALHDHLAGPLLHVA